MDYHEKKFIEALLYVARALESDPAGGAIKINKALYNADFGHMRAYGKPITGAEYQRLERGPAPRKLLPIREQLIASGDLELRTETYLGRTIHRLVVLREPDDTLFSPTEKELLDQAVAAVRLRSGNAASDASHREPGWQMVDEKETIPYETAFIRRSVTTDAVRRRISELASIHLP